MNPFINFDFSQITAKGFNESKVREAIIAPLLSGLGYSMVANIEPERTVQKIEWLELGHKKKTALRIDYAVKVGNRYVLVVEAKSSSKDINSDNHVAQALQYASHADINAPFYALCNGLDFVLYHRSQKKPILKFKLYDINKNWEQLYSLLGIENFTLHGSGFEKSPTHLNVVNTITQTNSIQNKPLLQKFLNTKEIYMPFSLLGANILLAIILNYFAGGGMFPVFLLGLFLLISASYLVKIKYFYQKVTIVMLLNLALMFVLYSQFQKNTEKDISGKYVSRVEDDYYQVKINGNNLSLNGVNFNGVLNANNANGDWEGRLCNNTNNTCFDVKVHIIDNKLIIFNKNINKSFNFYKE